MKDLKFLLVTNNFNELTVSFCNQLTNIGFVKTLESQANNKIINAIVQSEIDVVFLDVDYLGSVKASKIYHLIENITGKVCFYVDNENKNKPNNSDNFVLLSNYGYIDYNILKIDLLSLIIDSINKFNHNTLLRKEKCYDFIYTVWEDLSVKKVQIESIQEILKKEKATYVLCKDEKFEKRIINISFEMLYKLLNKNFEKSRFKITNKDWLNNSDQKTDFFLRNSA